MSSRYVVVIFFLLSAIVIKLVIAQNRVGEMIPISSLEEIPSFHGLSRKVNFSLNGTGLDGSINVHAYKLTSLVSMD